MKQFWYPWYFHLTFPFFLVIDLLITRPLVLFSCKTKNKTCPTLTQNKNMSKSHFNSLGNHLTQSKTYNLYSFNNFNKHLQHSKSLIWSEPPSLSTKSPAPKSLKNNTITHPNTPTTHQSKPQETKQAKPMHSLTQSPIFF